MYAICLGYRSVCFVQSVAAGASQGAPQGGHAALAAGGHLDDGDCQLPPFSVALYCVYHISATCDPTPKLRAFFLNSLLVGRGRASSSSPCQTASDSTSEDGGAVLALET